MDVGLMMVWYLMAITAQTMHSATLISGHIDSHCQVGAASDELSFDDGDLACYPVPACEVREVLR